MNNNYLDEFNLDEIKKEKFKIYYQVLVKANEYINLTAITDEEEVYIKHFYDSLLLVKNINISNKKILDVGSGAGFPGLCLAIIDDTAEITIVDCLKKRINFLESLKEKLSLKNINLIHARIEDLKELKESFDIVTARAVAKLNILLELCIPYVKVKSCFIALKGNNTQELDESKTAIEKLNIKLKATYVYDLPKDYGKRYIYEFQKEKPTNKIYPRLFFKIKQNPL